MNLIKIKNKIIPDNYKSKFFKNKKRRPSKSRKSKKALKALKALTALKAKKALKASKSKKASGLRKSENYSFGDMILNNFN